MLELAAKTEAGARLVRVAEGLADDLASRAAVHDREASFPHASVAALKDAGFFVAPIPVEHGGLGVTSVHDVVVASSRLARGDASVAIGVNLHLALVMNLVRRWQDAVAGGHDRRAAAFGASLEAIARDGVIMATAISEPAQDLTRPHTTATRTESGWQIDGRKIFCTMAPAATVLQTAVTFIDDDGAERYGYAAIDPGTPGVEIHDDWDALGMRASGSHSVTFADAEIPHSALRGGFAAGDAEGVHGPQPRRGAAARLLVARHRRERGRDGHDRTARTQRTPASARCVERDRARRVPRDAVAVRLAGGRGRGRARRAVRRDAGDQDLRQRDCRSDR